MVTNGVGAVYTPSGLAEWTATQLLRYAPPTALRILDPACGDGELLLSISQVSVQPVELRGMDVDSSAIAVASNRIKGSASFAVVDSLRPGILDGMRWKPDAIIVNPPWGRPDKQIRVQLQAAGYELAKGQFDLYEIFVERLVRGFYNVPMAFILPDSLFLPEHTRLRKFLLRNTEILFLARLGEGLFPGVYRGTVVLVLRSHPVQDSDVECFRLQPEGRNAFLREGASLEAMRKSQSYNISQKSFASNPNAELTLDVRTGESAVYKMLAQGTMHWSDWLWMGRGVEIGKSGKALLCNKCHNYRAVPKKGLASTPKCHHCSATFPEGSRTHQIVQHYNGSSRGPEWASIIVGEDVGRYCCVPSREVLINLPGIRYKDPQMMRSPKLLVRKTGVGIRAAVDRVGALTLQTVYHFIPKAGVPDTILDYMAGLLNSKTMLAFHLRWSGESEWRSHPYITPSTVKTLPIPSPFKDGTTLGDRATEISALAHRRSKGEDVEARIESLVQDLYGLTHAERQWVTDVIASAQSLRGIREMREPAMVGATIP